MSIDAPILILASLFDFSVDLICIELAAQGAAYVRINRETLRDSRISHYPKDSVLEYQFGEHSWIVSNPKSVLYRQPVFLRNTPGVALTIDEQLDRSQWMAFLRGLTSFDNALWINSPQATYLAESKPYQLKCAHKLGFKVPDSVITNDPEAVKSSGLGDPLVVKSVDTVLLREGDEELFAYTSVVSADGCLGAQSSDIPATYQRLLEPKLDLRVTVIAGRTYCVSITAEGKNISGDWRLSRREDLRYHEYPLPDEEAMRCRTLVSQLGLIFGAIDLAVVGRDIYFIEINPTGEWGWLNCPSRPIAEDFALALLEHHR